MKLFILVFILFMLTNCQTKSKDNDKQNQLLVLALASSSSSSSSGLTGPALDFFNILVAYRANGTYTLTSGTTRTFLNSSKCSGTTSQNTGLNRAAQKHTENMIRYNLFSHTGYDGSSFSDRIKAEGVTYTSAGENIAAGNSKGEETFDQWWNSSGHRSNMENCDYTHVGIGYAAKASINANADYSDYWTNKFAKIQ